jgi:hypothetical protein
MYGEEERRMQGFDKKSEDKKPLGRPRRRWEDNIKMDLLEDVFGGMGRIQLVQDRGWWRARVNTVIKLPVP